MVATKRMSFALGAIHPLTRAELTHRLNQQRTLITELETRIAKLETMNTATVSPLVNETNQLPLPNFNASECQCKEPLHYIGGKHCLKCYLPHRPVAK